MQETEVIPAPQNSAGVSEAPREAGPVKDSRPTAADDPDVRGRPGELGSPEAGRARPSRRLGLATLAVLAVALAALVPTVGDLGLTWDEPAYRYSQVMSAQWWEQLGRAPVLGRRPGAARSRTLCSTTGLTAGTGSISIRRWPAS